MDRRTFVKALQAVPFLAGSAFGNDRKMSGNFPELKPIVLPQWRR